MSQRSQTPNPLDPFETMRTIRDANLENWSKLMIDITNSEAYSQVMSTWLDAYITASLPFQRVLETTMTQVLTRLNMPTRADIISLAEHLNNIELRLDDLEAKLDEYQQGVAVAISRSTQEERA